MSAIEYKMLQHELESLLHEVEHEGFLVLPLHKLYRLLGRGNRAAGTWSALLDAWEGVGYERRALQIAELAGEKILLTVVPTEVATSWSGE